MYVSVDMLASMLQAFVCVKIWFADLAHAYQCGRTYTCVKLHICFYTPQILELCGTVSWDAYLLLSRLINEEIKVSVSQFRYKDTGGWWGGRGWVGSDTQLVPLKF